MSVLSFIFSSCKTESTSNNNSGEVNEITENVEITRLDYIEGIPCLLPNQRDNFFSYIKTAELCVDIKNTRPNSLYRICFEYKDLDYDSSIHPVTCKNSFYINTDANNQISYSGNFHICLHGYFVNNDPSYTADKAAENINKAVWADPEFNIVKIIVE